MKIELKDKKVFFDNGGSKKEIHPFWLRERVNGEAFIDKKTQQRLFDPTTIKKSIKIESLNLSNSAFPGIDQIGEDEKKWFHEYHNKHQSTVEKLKSSSKNNLR